MKSENSKSVTGDMRMINFFCTTKDKKRARQVRDIHSFLGGYIVWSEVVGIVYLSVEVNKLQSEFENIKFEEAYENSCAYILSEMGVKARGCQPIGDNHDNAKTAPKDNINPSHYQGSVQCIDMIKAITENKSGFEAKLTGDIVKYLWRYPEKNGLEDLKKAQWYLNKLIEEVEAQ